MFQIENYFRLNAMALIDNFKAEADNFFKVVNRTLSEHELKEVYALFKQVLFS